MIYPEVIRADRFHCQKHLLAEDLRLQPQLAIAAPGASSLETNSIIIIIDDLFCLTNLLIKLLGLACTFRVCMSLLGFALYFLHTCNFNCSLTLSLKK